MCVIRWHRYKNCDCQFITEIELCVDYKQNNSDKVSDFLPTVCMKEGEYPTEIFRKQLDGVFYTTGSSFLVMSAHLFPCHPYTETFEMEELAEVCPFCDDEDLQHRLEKKVSVVKQEMGEKEGREE